MKVRGSVAAGNHTVEITASFDKNAASSGYYFYFDYLWPLVPQDVPDAPKVYYRTCRSPSTSTPTTATRSLRPGTSGNSRSSGSRATPTCTWASSGTTSGGGSARPTRTPRSCSPATPARRRRGVDLDWRHHRQPRHRVRRDAAGHRRPTCARRSTACSPACGPTTTSDEHDAPDPEQGAKLYVHRHRGQRAATP